MINSGSTTFTTGHKKVGGRTPGSRSKISQEVDRIGEENCLLLYQVQLNFAFSGSPEEKMQSSQFLLNKIVPNAKGSRVSLELKMMQSMDDVQENENSILQAVSEGHVTLEEGEKLFSMTDQARKTIEASDIMQRLDEMQQRMKDAGIL